MSPRVPSILREHPLEAALAVGLLLILLAVGGEPTKANLVQNQAVPGCAAAACATQMDRG